MSPSAIFRKCLLFLFPLARAKTLIDFAIIQKLFNYKDKSSLLVIYPLLLFCMFTTFLSAIHAPILVHLQPFRSPILGLIGQFKCIASVFTISESVIIRFWLFHHLRKASSIDAIAFVHLLQNLHTKAHDAIVARVKFVSAQTLLGGYILNVVASIPMIMGAQNEWEIYMALAHLTIVLIIARNIMNDPTIIYNFAIAGSVVVTGQMEELKCALIEYRESRVSMVRVLAVYWKLVRSIKQLNSITRVIMASSSLCALPMCSCVIFIALLPNETVVYNIVKYTISVSAFILTVRGYFLVAVLSQVDTQSKKVHSMITCILARGEHGGHNDSSRLQLIIEDLSSLRSHLVLREATSSVTQMDFYRTVSSGVSLVTLFFSLVSV